MFLLNVCKYMLLCFQILNFKVLVYIHFSTNFNDLNFFVLYFYQKNQNQLVWAKGAECWSDTKRMNDMVSEEFT